MGCGKDDRKGSSLVGEVDMTLDEEMMEALSVELDTEAVLLERVTALPLPPDRLRNEGRSSSLPRIQTPRMWMAPRVMSLYCALEQGRISDWRMISCSISRVSCDDRTMDFRMGVAGEDDGVVAGVCDTCGQCVFD